MINLRRISIWAAVAVVGSLVASITLNQLIFDDAESRQAVAFASSDPKVEATLGRVQKAWVIKRTRYSSKPAYIQKEEFVIAVDGARYAGVAIVEVEVENNSVKKIVRVERR